MKCKHENTKKLFWLNQQRGKWITTNFSICEDCGSCVGMQPVETVTKETKKSLQEETKEVLSE